MPNFFYFDYSFDPLPGKRLWLRLDDKHFVERYPDGTESRFRILGHAKAREKVGTVEGKTAGDPGQTHLQRFTHELHTVQRAGTNQECPPGSRSSASPPRRRRGRSWRGPWHDVGPA